MTKWIPPCPNESEILLFNHISPYRIEKMHFDKNKNEVVLVAQNVTARYSR